MHPPWSFEILIWFAVLSLILFLFLCLGACDFDWTVLFIPMKFFGNKRYLDWTKKNQIETKSRARKSTYFVNSDSKVKGNLAMC